MVQRFAARAASRRAVPRVRIVGWHSRRSRRVASAVRRQRRLEVRAAALAQARRHLRAARARSAKCCRVGGELGAHVGSSRRDTLRAPARSNAHAIDCRRSKDQQLKYRTLRCVDRKLLARSCARRSPRTHELLRRREIQLRGPRRDPGIPREVDVVDQVLGAVSTSVQRRSRSRARTRAKASGRSTIRSFSSSRLDAETALRSTRTRTSGRRRKCASSTPGTRGRMKSVAAAKRGEGDGFFLGEREMKFDPA